jgi:hypothetical protein
LSGPHLRKTTSCTELNALLERRTGLAWFDFTRTDERASMGHLLYLIMMGTWPTTKVMLSALVPYLNSNDPGTGFYSLAQELEILPVRASAQKNEEFWVTQVIELQEYYSRVPR